MSRKGQHLTAGHGFKFFLPCLIPSNKPMIILPSACGTNIKARIRHQPPRVRLCMNVTARNGHKFPSSTRKKKPYLWPFWSYRQICGDLLYSRPNATQHEQQTLSGQAAKHSKQQTPFQKAKVETDAQFKPLYSCRFS